MKRSTLLLPLLLAMLCACVWSGGCGKSTEDWTAAERSANDFFEALRGRDFDKVFDSYESPPSWGTAVKEEFVDLMRGAQPLGVFDFTYEVEMFKEPGRSKGIFSFVVTRHWAAGAEAREQAENLKLGPFGFVEKTNIALRIRSGTWRVLSFKEHAPLKAPTK